jgi:CxxC motif-containing protein
MGCALHVEECETGLQGNAGAFPSLAISGNRCPRGVVYAQEELRAPKRVVTATCPIVGAPERSLYALRRAPVKTVVPCPRELIPALLADIYKTGLSLPVQAGDRIIADWQGQGIDVIAVRTVL